MFLNQVKPILKEKKKVVVNSSIYIAFAISIILIVLFSYICNFSSLGLSTNQAEWAQFGDYFGGVLNPILAFLAFLALLKTISLQSKAIDISKEELSATRQELEKSRIAQEEQSKSLQLQNKATQFQTFENTFFKLIDTHNSLISEFTMVPYKGDKALSYYLTQFKNTDTFLSKDNDNNIFSDPLKIKTNFQLTGNGINLKFIETIYIILKLIENNIDKGNEKFYIEVMLSQISTEELIVIFYYGVSMNIKMKPLLERYEFFSTLDSFFLRSLKEDTKLYNKEAYSQE